MQKWLRYIAVIAVLLTCGRAWAQEQNPCINNTNDYHTTATGGHEDSKVIRGTSGALGSGPTHFCQAFVTNNSGSGVWAMIFDSATLPSNGAKPTREFGVASTGTGWIYAWPLTMSNLVIACSSTEGTLTVTTTNACNFGVTIATH